MKAGKLGGVTLPGGPPGNLGEAEAPELWKRRRPPMPAAIPAAAIGIFQGAAPALDGSLRGSLLYVRPTGFKDTGLFPEQSANWDFMAEKIRRAGEKAGFSICLPTPAGLR